MRRLCVALLVLAGCSFDRGGLGSQAGHDDASVQPGTPDAAVQPGMPDAAVAPTIDAMMPGTPDAGPDHAGIGCGTMTCTGNNVCCVGTGGPGGGGQTFECKDHCGGNEGTYACDGPEDCPGEDCCFSRTGSRCANGCSLGEQAACRMSSDCGGVDSCCPTQYPNVELCQLACF